MLLTPEMKSNPSRRGADPPRNESLSSGADRYTENHRSVSSGSGTPTCSNREVVTEVNSTHAIVIPEYTNNVSHSNRCFSDLALNDKRQRWPDIQHVYPGRFRSTKKSEIQATRRSEDEMFRHR